MLPPGAAVLAGQRVEVEMVAIVVTHGSSLGFSNSPAFAFISVDMSWRAARFKVSGEQSRNEKDHSSSESQWCRYQGPYFSGR